MLRKRLFRTFDSVPKGTYLCLSEFSFRITKEKGETLRGKPNRLFLRVPLVLFLPLVLMFTTLFMMFLPALGIVGMLYLIPSRLRKMARRKSILLFLLIAVPSAIAQQEDHLCIACHAKSQTFVRFRNGEQLLIRFSLAEYQKHDVHTGKVKCVECHEDYSVDFHPQLTAFGSIKEYRMARYNLCQKCHEDQYKGYQESVHHGLIESGNDKAPVCSDCHVSHSIVSLKKSRRQVVETCRNCHEKIYDVYRTSVHGRALLEFDNPDVPTCIDCHSAHGIKDPRIPLQRMASPQVCSRCHADKKLMSKYRLRADVYETYLDDFHGVTTSFYRKAGVVGDPSRVTAVCVDCHGIHNIKSPRSGNGAVDPEYVNRMCSKCHNPVPENFSQAWLSHYRPSLKKFPLVFAAKAFYWFFIPFTVLGLAVHIALHLRATLKERGKEEEHDEK